MRGVEPKAQTQLIFHGPLDYTRENVFALGSLAEVMTIRLRETLREDMGGTYGVSVQASPSRYPRSEYELRIGFGSAPERTDELTSEVRLAEQRRPFDRALKNRARREMRRRRRARLPPR